MKSNGDGMVSKSLVNIYSALDIETFAETFFVKIKAMLQKRHKCDSDWIPNIDLPELNISTINTSSSVNPEKSF